MPAGRPRSAGRAIALGDSRRLGVGQTGSIADVRDVYSTSHNSLGCSLNVSLNFAHIRLRNLGYSDVVDDGGDRFARSNVFSQL